MASRLLAVASILAVVLADRNSIIHEKRELLSEKWVKGDRVSPETLLPVRIGLKQNQNAAENAHSWLMDVSDPTSENYGKHWSQEEVIAAFQPTEESVEKVLEWLVETGAISRDRVTHTDNKAWLAFDASTAELEHLLETEYHQHDHVEGGRGMISCDEYRIPQELQAHIDYITPGVKGIHTKHSDWVKRSIPPTGGRGKPHFAHAEPKPKPDGNGLGDCDKQVTPACLQALYGFEPLNASSPVYPNNSMGIFEEGSYYDQEDMNLFYKEYTPYIANGTQPQLALIDGAVGPVGVKQGGGEALLDFQLATPIVWPQNTTLYSTDDYHYASGRSKYTGILNTFLDALDGSYCTYSAFGETGDDPKLDPHYPDPGKGGYNGVLMCGVYKPTNVISISYGEQENQLPYFYQQRQCNEYLKLGLQGVSIFVASGDTGVGGTSDTGSGRLNGCLRGGKVFSPTQPNSCPYVTNVGATKVAEGNTVHEPEVAAYQVKYNFSSSGGFSNIFTAPDYQKSTLKTYFANHNPPYPYYTDGHYNNSKGLYNRNGRGIPDVAANGQNIAGYLDGEFALGAGTSASSPIFASLVNRIINERLLAGKGPLGFINPTLYQNPGVLNDITSGDNPGCGTKGFSCVKGWDPVTGLGTPNYPKMLELFMGLP